MFYKENYVTFFEPICYFICCFFLSLFTFYSLTLHMKCFHKYLSLLLFNSSSYVKFLYHILHFYGFSMCSSVTFLEKRIKSLKTEIIFTKIWSQPSSYILMNNNINSHSMSRSMGDFPTVPFHSSARAQTNVFNTEHVRRAQSELQKRTVMSAVANVSKVSH